MKLTKIENKKLKKTSVSQKTIDKQFEGDLEKTVESNMGEKLKKIKEFEGNLKERWEFEGDSNFYFSICFRSKEERDSFVEANEIKLHDGQFIFAEEL